MTQSVFNLAAYILQRRGEMTAMKLQKLVYYCQAWALVWDEHPLFSERLEAWANGPVVPELYAWHRGLFKVSHDRLPAETDPRVFTVAERESIDAVLKHYGDRSSQWLSDLTHMEAPWRDARKGLDPAERSSREITHVSMAEYYGSLPPAP